MINKERLINVNISLRIHGLKTSNDRAGNGVLGQTITVYRYTRGNNVKKKPEYQTYLVK